MITCLMLLRGIPHPLRAYLQVYAYEIASDRGEQAAKASVEKLLSNGSEAKWTFPYAGTKDAKNAYADAERAEVDGFFNRNFGGREIKVKMS